MSAGLAECFHCFPGNVPPDAKPCQILIGGRWTDGFLLEWQRGEDRRWKGLVNYQHEAERRIALKDQNKLRPAGDVCYASQLREDPHPQHREIRAVDQAVGAAVGTETANAGLCIPSATTKTAVVASWMAE